MRTNDFEVTDFERLIDSIFGTTVKPKVGNENNVKEKEIIIDPTLEKHPGCIILNWDLPGAVRDQLSIETEESSKIIVKGLDGRYKNFESKVKIKDIYDVSRATAELKYGVLKIVIPDNPKPANKKINIY